VRGLEATCFNGTWLTQAASFAVSVSGRLAMQCALNNLSNFVEGYVAQRRSIRDALALTHAKIRTNNEQ
jgi:hypothetical protein